MIPTKSATARLAVSGEYVCAMFGATLALTTSMKTARGSSMMCPERCAFAVSTKQPEVIESLGKKASDTTKKILEKTKEVSDQTPPNDAVRLGQAQAQFSSLRLSLS